MNDKLNKYIIKVEKDSVDKTISCENSEGEYEIFASSEDEAMEKFNNRINFENKDEFYIEISTREINIVTEEDLRLIRGEILIHCEDNAFTKEDMERFESFSNAYDVINAYESDYHDGLYKEHLKIIYREIKQK